MTSDEVPDVTALPGTGPTGRTHFGSNHLAAVGPDLGAGLLHRLAQLDGGGEVLSETGDQQWQLSGTLGQWDDSASQALSGAGWTHTGGFWPVNIDQTNIMFRDGFEGEAL